MSEANKKYFEYLFMDIEWNQTPGTLDMENREPTQMTILAADQNLEKTKLLSKALRISNAENLSEEMLQLTHTCKENVMAGHDPDVVFQSVGKTFPTFGYIVVWTYDTYELFVRSMKRAGVPLRKHVVVVLQDVLKVAASKGAWKISFENALQCAEIPYQENFLHYSRHDTEYLFQLYKKCLQDYRDLTEGENCIANVRTGKLHNRECRYAKNQESENMHVVPKNMIFQGLSLCKVCRRKEQWKKFRWTAPEKLKEKSTKTSQTRQRKPPAKPNAACNLRKLPLTEQNIEKICRKARLSCHIIDNAVFIKSRLSRWIVYLDGNRVSKLCHENYKPNREQYLKRQRQKFTEGYHKQELHSDNFYEVIQYIRKHEIIAKNRLSQKSRIDQLFDQIKTSTNAKEDESSDVVSDENISAVSDEILSKTREAYEKMAHQ